MRRIIFILMAIFCCAMMNVQSIGTLSIILLSVYVIYNLSGKTKSVVDLAKDEKISQAREDAVSNMIKDFGKVTAAMVNGKPADVSANAILKSTHKVAADTRSIFDGK